MPTDNRYHTADLNLQVNGQSCPVTVRHHWTLLDVLREQLDLTGSKRGCDRGECGSCTVLLDGQPVYSCQLLAVQVGRRTILTIEGLAGDETLDAVQQAFLDNDGGQCGFCTPGFVMSTRALLNDNPNPTDAEIRQALSGNLCRCNAYGRIIASVQAARSGIGGGTTHATAQGAADEPDWGNLPSATIATIKRINEEQGPAAAQAYAARIEESSRQEEQRALELEKIFADDPSPPAFSANSRAARELAQSASAVANHYGTVARRLAVWSGDD